MTPTTERARNRILVCMTSPSDLLLELLAYSQDILLEVRSDNLQERFRGVNLVRLPVDCVALPQEQSVVVCTEQLAHPVHAMPEDLFAIYWSPPIVDLPSSYELAELYNQVSLAHRLGLFERIHRQQEQTHSSLRVRHQPVELRHLDILQALDPFQPERGISQAQPNGVELVHGRDAGHNLGIAQTVGSWSGGGGSRCGLGNVPYLCLEHWPNLMAKSLKQYLTGREFTPNPIAIAI